MRINPGWIRPALLGLLGTGAIVALLLWLTGAFRDKVEPGPPAHVLPSLPEGTATIEIVATTVPVHESAIGTIEPVSRIEVGSRLLARIDAVHVTAGQAVAAGDVLVELDSTDLRARLAEAHAAVRAADATLTQSRRDLDRARELRAEKIASQTEVDNAQTRFEQGTANLERARQAATAAESSLSFATLRAPSAGIVVDKYAEAGSLARPGQVLLTMYDPDRLQLVASVRERVAAALRVGDTVEVRVDALDKTCAATVAQIVPEAARESRAFEVKVTGPCPPGIYSGMFGRLLIPVGSRAEIHVPRAALRRTGQLDQVFAVLDDGRVSRRFVRTGRETADDVEVLSGLAVGETIVAEASRMLP